MGNGSQDAELWTWTSDKWKTAYESIQRVNYFMENIDRIESISPELKNRLCAEARFIRAMTYSDIMFLWGGCSVGNNDIGFKDRRNGTYSKRSGF
ncbi:MAG: hypothetical protein ACLVEJ_10205 [Parabacteroides sp.]